MAVTPDESASIGLLHNGNISSSELASKSRVSLKHRAPSKEISSFLRDMYAASETVTRKPTQDSSSRLEELGDDPNEPSSDSDSDLGEIGASRPHHITERRRVQNAKFSAW